MSEHHTIKITVEPEHVTSEFSCSAPVGADCRLGCGEQCAAWLNGDPCGHPRTHDEGFCLPITWLQEDDTYWYESYDGTLTTARSGPIVTRWDGDYYVWTYLNGPGTVYAERDAYRDVLRDLIAELRDKHRRDPYASDPHCLGCADWPHWPCDEQSLLDRAEQRLREVNGE